MWDVMILLALIIKYNPSPQYQVYSQFECNTKSLHIKNK